jgi:hypothetical protein
MSCNGHPLFNPHSQILENLELWSRYGDMCY